MSVSTRRGARLSLLLALLCVPGAARAERDAGATASTDAGLASPVFAPDPRTPHVRSLVAGTLDVATEPQALFEVSLGDEAALQVERARLRALLDGVNDRERAQAAPEPAAPSVPLAAEQPQKATLPDLGGVDPARWAARVELDRARLAFFELPEGRRQELLRAHAARRQASRPREAEQDRRAREAEADRQRALQAAREARSEAERLAREEEARLIGVEQSIATVREELRTARDELASRRDALFGWQHRTKAARAGTTEDADATYSALRRTLRVTRDELAAALDELSSATTRVPSAGPDRLEALPPEIPTEAAAERRRGVERQIREAAAMERSLLEERATALLDEMNALNSERLGLLEHLSPERRGAVTGFSAAGFDQARSEARHLLLVLRYHRHIVANWLGAWGSHAGIGGIGFWRLSFVVVPCLLAAAAFVWWRRRSPALLADVEKRVAEADREERLTAPSLTHKAIRFLGSVHRPLEGLFFFGALVWLLPEGVRALLEMQLLVVVVGWTLAAALIVNAIDAIAATTSNTAGMPAATHANGLRLRSLRLVGRVVVSFILVLLISKRLVGEGTVYQWVASTCWFAGIPVFLVLVRWWRETVFARVDRARRKSRLESWVLENRSGWKSFFAAMIAAVQLFGHGAFKTLRNWLVGFNLARRAHAYLFKRELDRLASEQSSTASRALSSEELASLSPERAMASWVECPADEHLERLRRRVTDRKGGVVVLIGGRGSGKTSFLRRLETALPGARALHCDAHTSVEAVRAALVQRQRGTPESNAENAPSLVLLDDAHSIIKPILGGLRTFDDCLALARSRSVANLWIFAIDDVVWPFLQRARDARPLFDELIVLRPWKEEQIGALLSQRSAAASLTPSFEDLLEELPPTADEIDKQEALSAKRTGYFRMVWDYARGNPAIALEVWRSSLVRGRDEIVRVRPLQTPGSAELEALPDASLFILRAVLQLGPASVPDIAEATRLTQAQVQDAVGFGRAHGYLEQEGGKTRVSWSWLRAIVHLLERRHLLVGP